MKNGSSAGHGPPLGIRAVAVLLAHLKLFLATTLGFGVLGFGAALTMPSTCFETATVEVGTRFLNKPLEHPRAAAARLRGHGLARASEAGIDVRIDIAHRQDARGALTRFLDVAVHAGTADAAHEVLERGLERFLAEHRELHDREVRVLRDQLARLDAIEALLMSGLAREPEADDDGPDALSSALYQVHRRQNGTRSILSAITSPPTRVVARTGRPVKSPNRARIFVLGGLCLGLLVSVSVAARRGGSTSGPVDPVTQEIIHFLGRHGWLIAGSTVVGTVGALALSLSEPAPFVGVLSMSPSTVDEAPVRSLDVAAQELESSLYRRALEGSIRLDGLAVRVVRDQPPRYERINLIEVEIAGSDEATVRSALGVVVESLEQSQRPLVDAEQARLQLHLGNLTQAFERHLRGPAPPSRHLAAMDLIQEIADAERVLSPSRTHAPSILVPPTVRAGDRAARIGIITVAGLVSGVFAGLLLAFLLAGASAMRLARADASDGG